MKHRLEILVQFLDCLRLLEKFCGRLFCGSRTTESFLPRKQLPDAAFPLAMNGSKRPGVGLGLSLSVIVEHSLLSRQIRIVEQGWGGVASTHS